MGANATSQNLGAGDPCPSCGSRSGVAPDHDGYVCLTCGTPRILVTASVERARAERPLLERAKEQRFRRAAWGVLASISLALGGAALALGALVSLVFHLGPTAVAAMGSVVMSLLAVSALGFWTSRRAGRATRDALEEARAVVAKELIAARGGALDASELAALLRIAPSRAEELVAAAQVDRMLEGDRFRVGAPIDEVASEAEEGEARKMRG